MRPGFTLIELILAFMFSSMILTVLFTSFFQINRSALTTEDLIEMGTRVATVQGQLEKDIEGAFVPVQGLPLEQKEEKKKEGAQAEAQKKATSGAEKEGKKDAAEVKKPEAAKKEKKEKPKPINDVFLSTNKGEIINELTFITNNPTRVYEFAENSERRPCIVRVVYRLVVNSQRKDSFTLTRQEGTPLEFEMYKKGGKIKAYELATNVKTLSISFAAPVPKEEKKEEKKDKKEAAAKAPPKEQQKKKEEPPVFETKKEWRSNDTREKKPVVSQLPQLVTVTLVLWDNQYENERMYTFKFEIPAFGQDLVKPKEEEKRKPMLKKDDEPQKKDEAQKKAQPEAQAAKKAAEAHVHRARINVAELKASVEEFMKMLNGKPS